MGAILVAMPRHEDSSRICDIIRQSDIWEDVFVCDTGSEVLRRIEDMDISLVVCTRRLSDMGFEELHDYMPASSNMLLLTKDVQIGLFSSNIVILQMPFKTSDLISSIKMVLPGGYRPRNAKKARSPGDKITIDKAKMLLMERNNMSEPEAYRYLQKNSMDMGRTLLETAYMILSLGTG